MVRRCLIAPFPRWRRPWLHHQRLGRQQPRQHRRPQQHHCHWTALDPRRRAGCPTRRRPSSWTTCCRRHRGPATATAPRSCRLRRLRSRWEPPPPLPRLPSPLQLRRQVWWRAAALGDTPMTACGLSVVRVLCVFCVFVAVALASAAAVPRQRERPVPIAVDGHSPGSEAQPSTDVRVCAYMCVYVHRFLVAFMSV